MSSKKIIIAAGGTGGHIIPALAIGKELAKRNVDILFVGNRQSMEEKLFTEADFNFRSIKSQKFYRSFTYKHLFFPYRLIKSIIDSKKIISDFKPDAFVGTGGFVSGPVGYAAHLCKIPIFLQEQNSYPGVTTRILSKYAQKVFLGNQGAAKYLKIEQYEYSGNPINPSVAKEVDKIDYKKFNLSPHSKKVFLFGGSQGSVILNKAFLPIIDNLLALDMEVIWQIGKYSFNDFYPKIKDKKGVYAFDFTSQMGQILNSADLVIARAGALSLAEIETKKIPSILIPLPSAAGNHQYYNALELVHKHTGVLLEQKHLEPSTLMETINKVLTDLAVMKRNVEISPHKNAAQTIALNILEKIKQEL